VEPAFRAVGPGVEERDRVLVDDLVAHADPPGGWAATSATIDATGSISSCGRPPKVGKLSPVSARRRAHGKSDAGPPASRYGGSSGNSLKKGRPSTPFRRRGDPAASRRCRSGSRTE